MENTKLGTSNDDQPFEPGEEIDFCGDTYIVVKNYGNTGVVRESMRDPSEVKFSWIFEGTHCLRTGRRFDLTPEASAKPSPSVG